MTNEKNEIRKVKLPEPLTELRELNDDDLETVAGGCTLSCAGNTCGTSCGQTS